VKVCQSLLALEATLLFWFTWSGHISIAWLLLLATFQGIISSAEIPARQSLIVELAGRDELPQAIALQSSGFNLARIVGPALAALVIAKLGIAWAFGVNAISYAAVLASLWMVRLPAWVPRAARVPPWEGIRESVRYMRDTPLVAALMRLVTVYAIFGALGIAAQSGRQAGNRTMVAGSYAFPAVLLAFSVVTDARIAYPLLFLAGVGMIVNSAVANSMLQHIVPDAMRGRLMAAYSFVVVGLSQTIGSLVAGMVARAFGVQWAIAIGAVLMLVYALRAFGRAPLRELVTPGAHAS
jgi:MFS family permease